MTWGNMCTKYKLDIRMKKNNGLARQLHLQEISSELCLAERKYREVGKWLVQRLEMGMNLIE